MTRQGVNPIQSGLYDIYRCLLFFTDKEFCNGNFLDEPYFDATQNVCANRSNGEANSWFRPSQIDPVLAYSSQGTVCCGSESIQLQTGLLVMVRWVEHSTIIVTFMQYFGMRIQRVYEDIVRLTTQRTVSW